MTVEWHNVWVFDVSVAEFKFSQGEINVVLMTALLSHDGYWEPINGPF